MSLLTTVNLAKAYGPDDIFSGVAVSIPRRARIGMVGSNGVGKTTLLRILIGEEAPSEGSVQKVKQLKIGYLPQESVLDSPQTLWDESRTALSHLEKMQHQLEEMEAVMSGGAADEDLLERYSNLQDTFERKGGYTYENTIERTYHYLKNIPKDSREDVFKHLDRGLLSYAYTTAKTKHDVYNFFKNM